MTDPGNLGTPTRRERREQQDRAGARRRTVVIIVVVVLVAGAGAGGWYFFARGDSSSSTNPTSSSSSSSSSSTRSSASTTSTSSTASTNTSSTSTLPTPGDPQSYAQTLFTTWANNDRTAAATVADRAAIDSLFATPGSEAAAYTFSGCTGAAGSIFCTWTRAGAQLAMTVRDATGGLPVRVVDVTIGPG